jgi:hypothetical protein
MELIQKKKHGIIGLITDNMKIETFLNVDLSEVLRYFNVNTLALLSVCREFIRNQNSGGIINFSSIYSTLSPRNDIYNEFEKNILFISSWYSFFGWTTFRSNIQWHKKTH